MGVGAKEIIALLVNLRDELGLPIVVVGTYKALRLLEGDMSTGRRLVEGGYFDLQRPLASNDVSWTNLCEIVWRFQWVKDPIQFDSNICAALYDVSQGITGIMLSAFSFAQLAAISDGSERVDEKLIRKVYADRMKPLHSALRVLQSGDPLLMDNSTTSTRIIGLSRMSALTTQNFAHQIPLQSPPMTTKPRSQLNLPMNHGLHERSLRQTAPRRR